jgi:hypothetical protein
MIEELPDLIEIPYCPTTEGYLMLVILKESSSLVLPTLALNWCEDYISRKDVIIGPPPPLFRIGEYL